MRQYKAKIFSAALLPAVFLIFLKFLSIYPAETGFASLRRVILPPAGSLVRSTGLFSFFSGAIPPGPVWHNRPEQQVLRAIYTPPGRREGERNRHIPGNKPFLRTKAPLFPPRQSSRQKTPVRRSSPFPRSPGDNKGKNTR